nr:MAG TPA: PcfK-like protein [Bacteriophage sp.]
MAIIDDAKTPYEKAIAQFLEKQRHVNNFLDEQLKKNTRTLNQCWEYIKNMAKSKAQNGCAMIEDSVVYGWAEDFFTMAEEEYKKLNVKKRKKSGNKTSEKSENRESEKKKTKEDIKENKVQKKTEAIVGQTSLFDFLGE